MIKPVPFEQRKAELRIAAHSVGSFFAMGCPCEVLMETTDEATAQRLLTLARDEAFRLEALWSRYLPSSLVQVINAQPDTALTVDSETAALLDYCEQLWQLSDGGFDITSGVLREVWRFDGRSKVPSAAAVADVMQRVGWNKVHWQAPVIRMRAGMQIDFGGVGKEYAVDRCAAKLRLASPVSCLVNFGGDCAVSRPPRRSAGWQIGIEAVTAPGSASRMLAMTSGAIATSGNTHRYLWHNGERLSHIFDARTGWPVSNAPASVTVRANTCLEAGMLATLGCLQGAVARTFFEDEGIEAYLQD